jgi:hypothetical protein
MCLPCPLAKQVIEQPAETEAGAVIPFTAGDAAL